MPKQNAPTREELSRIVKVRERAAKASRAFTRESIKDLPILEQIAWLHAAHRPAKEIHDATTIARGAGISWKHIAAAKGHGDDEAAARVAANVYVRWKERNE